MRRKLVGLCVLSVMSNAAFAQSRDTSKSPANPADTAVATPACCSIVRIEAAKSLVTARETATGFTFRFAVNTRRLLGTLKIGQPVWADFAAKTVKLKATDIAACCAIVDIPPPAGSGTLGVPQEHR